MSVRSIKQAKQQQTISGKKYLTPSTRVLVGFSRDGLMARFIYA